MKKFAVVLYTEAIADFKEALKHYRDISPAVSKKFRGAVNTTVNDLKKNPFYQIRYDNFRLKVVKKFPYVFHFIVNEDAGTVFVYGIRNSHKDPDTSYFFKK